MKKLIIFVSICINADQEFDSIWKEMQQIYTIMINSENKNEVKKFHTNGWEKMRSLIRNKILGHPDKGVLTGTEISISMVRQGYGETQVIETTYLQNFITKNTYELLKKYKFNDKGMLQKTSKEFSCSSNTLGHLYYASKIIEHFGSNLKSIIEFGGGYGSLAKILKSTIKDSTYTIIDLPESLALQYIFIKYTDPNINLNIIYNHNENIRPNCINLVPIYIVNELNLESDLFVSTFALNETPQYVQDIVTKKRFFKANNCYFTGSLTDSMNIYNNLRNVFINVLSSTMHLGLGLEVICHGKNE